MLLLDPFGKYGIICTCACMFRSFYLSVATLIFAGRRSRQKQPATLFQIQQ